MQLTARVRTARRPLPTAMAIALAAAVLSLLSVASDVSAQVRGNAQAEQSRTLRNRPSEPALPPVGRYAADSGEGFILDRSGRHPLLRFDRRDETWVLRPSAAPRGDVIYRNDAGQQVLRVTPSGGMTVYTPRSPGGSPASYAGPGESLSPPRLGPAQMLNLMLRRSAMVSQAVGRTVEINADTGVESESLTVEALILSTDVVLRIARSPNGRAALNQLRRIVIVEGSRASVTYNRGELHIVVAPSQGAAGRPSSARVIRAFLPPAR
ncbi:MAG: DUF4908 domain-containing protein [Caulobacterales bacterium]|nr:DUF4908 domain-containing protein [Caulobacterales bacterium]